MSGSTGHAAILGYQRADGRVGHPRRRRGRVPRRVRRHGRRGDRRRAATTCTSSASAAAIRAPTRSGCSSSCAPTRTSAPSLLVSLGCEGFDREGLAEASQASGRPVTTLVIQQRRRHPGDGRRGTGLDRPRCAAAAATSRRSRIELTDLVVGTICGGSDGTSGITANPVVGRVFDHLVAAGGTAIFEETGELIGCEHHMAGRAITPELGRRDRGARRQGRGSTTPRWATGASRPATPRAG